MSAAMYVVLRWSRWKTWPDGQVGSVVDDHEEAVKIADDHRHGAVSRGEHARFTVHTVSWPPVHEAD
jgi:hypothetical protein